MARDPCVSKAQEGSEDCLFLNVHVPPNRDRTKTGAGTDAGVALPVLVFIHGGSFIFGAGSDYDGTWLAANNGVVVVTLNYRLGLFGWAQPVAGLGNFGLKDQREAIRWMKDNAKSFGGDASKMLVRPGAVVVGLLLCCCVGASALPVAVSK